MPTPRKPDWADKLAKKKYGYEEDGCIAQLLRAEHARAVRVVTRYRQRYATPGSPAEFVCVDILAALKKGRP